MRAERTHGSPTRPWVRACLLPENRPLPSASLGRVAGKPGVQAGHLIPTVTAIPSLHPRKRRGDAAAPRGAASAPGLKAREESEQVACGHSWPDVGEVAQGHTDNSRPLDPYREGTLMGRVRLACRGGGAGRTKRPLSTQGGRPGRVTLAHWLCAQLFSVVVRTRWPGSGGVGKKGAVSFPDVPGSSYRSEPPPRP